MRVGEVRVINGKPSLVTAGSYYGSNGGVSNFWYWRTIRKDGSLGKEYHGYNNGSNTVGPVLKHTIKVQIEELA